MGQVLFLSLLAAANSLMLAAVTVMLSLSRPKRLLLGYLLGGYSVSISLGLVFIFWAEGRHSAQAAQEMASPTISLAAGTIAILIACVVGFRLDEKARYRASKRTREPRQAGEPHWQRALDRGSARFSFLVGMLLTLPGGRYLAALNELAKLDYATTATVAAVVLVNLILLLLVEIPLLGYTLAEDWTPLAVGRFKEWVGRNRRRIVLVVALAVGGVLLVRGAVALW
jgi:Sap, sulfolipid-1-addressing protein